MSLLAAPPSTTARRYDLDWLRVLAFGLLIFYHTGMVFVGWDFHLMSKPSTPVLELPMEFLNQWRMPLLFVISGVGLTFALARRTAGQFVGERLQRLLLPLAFGMVVVVEKVEEILLALLIDYLGEVVGWQVQLGREVGQR